MKPRDEELEQVVIPVLLGESPGQEIVPFPSGYINWLNCYDETAKFFPELSLGDFSHFIYKLFLAGTIRVNEEHAIKEKSGILPKGHRSLIEYFDCITKDNEHRIDFERMFRFRHIQILNEKWLPVIKPSEYEAGIIIAFLIEAGNHSITPASINGLLTKERTPIILESAIRRLQELGLLVITANGAEWHPRPVAVSSAGSYKACASVCFARDEWPAILNRERISLEGIKQAFLYAERHMEKLSSTRIKWMWERAQSDSAQRKRIASNELERIGQELHFHEDLLTLLNI